MLRYPDENLQNSNEADNPYEGVSEPPGRLLLKIAFKNEAVCSFLGGQMRISLQDFSDPGFVVDRLQDRKALSGGLFTLTSRSLHTD